MINLLKIFVILLLATGCSKRLDIKIQYTPTTEKSTVNTASKNYILGVENIVSVGESLIYIETYGGGGAEFLLVDTYAPKEDFTIRMETDELSFKAGEKYFSIYKHKNTNFLQHKSSSTLTPSQSWMLYVPIDKQGGLVGENLFYLGKNFPKNAFRDDVKVLFGHSRFKLKKGQDFPEFVLLDKTPILKEREKALTKLFVNSLIYTGKSKNTIRVLVREYTGEDKIRDAFTHELIYDLNESNIISYKDIRIQVIEATNEWIKYTVLSD